MPFGKFICPSHQQKYGCMKGIHSTSLSAASLNALITVSLVESKSGKGFQCTGNRLLISLVEIP